MLQQANLNKCVLRTLQKLSMSMQVQSVQTTSSYIIVYVLGMYRVRQHSLKATAVAYIFELDHQDKLVVFFFITLRV